MMRSGEDILVRVREVLKEWGKMGKFVSVLVEVGIITPSSRRAMSSALVRGRSYHSRVLLIELLQ